MTFYNVSIIDLRCRTFQPIRCMFEEVYFQYHNVATLATLQKMNGCFNPFFFLLPQFHASLLIRYISFSAFANVPESAWPLSCLLFGM